jgi:hypothetical protein
LLATLDDDDTDNGGDDQPGDSALKSSEHGPLFGPANAIRDRHATRFSVGDALDLLFEPAEATDVRTTPATFEQTTSRVEIVADADCRHSRTRSRSPMLSGLRLPEDSSKRKLPALEESSQQKKYTKTSQAPLRDVNHDRDHILVHQAAPVSPAQWAFHDHSPRDQSTSDMLDSQSSHFMQNYDAASFSGGRPGATPSRMLDIGVDTLAGSLPDIAHSQFWPGFNADISTGSFAGGIVSQFEPGLKHGDSIGCHPAGNFETPPSRQGVWDGLDHASGEEYTMRYAGELRSDQAIDENTGANYYLLDGAAYSAVDVTLSGQDLSHASSATLSRLQEIVALSHASSITLGRS